jgi:hypothetical protein
MTCPTDICHRVPPSGIVTKANGIGCGGNPVRPDSHRRTTYFSDLSGVVNRPRQALKILLKINHMRCSDATFLALTAAAMRNNGARRPSPDYCAAGVTPPTVHCSDPGKPSFRRFFCTAIVHTCGGCGRADAHHDQLQCRYVNRYRNCGKIDWNVLGASPTIPYSIETIKSHSDV